jgi:hypothetical protein
MSLFFEESMIIWQIVEVETTSFPLLRVDYPKSFKDRSTTGRKEYITKFTEALECTTMHPYA